MATRIGKFLSILAIGLMLLAYSNFIPTVFPSELVADYCQKSFPSGNYIWSHARHFCHCEHYPVETTCVPEDSVSSGFHCRPAILDRGRIWLVNRRTVSRVGRKS